MRCSQCQKFKGLRKYNNSLNGSYWKCDGREILADTPSCENFVLYHIIICPKKNKFRHMDVEVCLHYQKEKNCKCRTGFEVRTYLRKQPSKLIRRK
jgi:hypothetical protein